MRRLILLLGLAMGLIGFVILLPSDSGIEEELPAKIQTESEAEVAPETTPLVLTREAMSADGESSTPVPGADEKRRLEEAEYLFLVGRILNTEGLVASNIEFQIEIVTEIGNRHLIYPRKLTTDFNGRFRYRVEGRMLRPGNRTFRVIMRKTNQKPLRGSASDFSTAPHVGAFELGDLVVRELPAVMGGVVLDTRGGRIPGAKILVKRRNYDQTSWRILRDFQVVTDARGAFEVKGWGDKDLQLSVHADHYFGTYQTVEDSDFGVNLILENAIEVSGRILMDPGFDEGDYDLVIARESRKNDSTRLLQQWLGGRNGEFTFDKVPPGVVNLVLRHRASKFDLHQWNDIEIPFDNHAMVIPDLDVRGLLTKILVKLVDEEGHFLKRAWIKQLGGGVEQDGRHGIIRVVGTTPSFDIEVGGSGKRKARYEGLTENQTIILRDGFHIQMSVNSFIGLSEEWEFSAELASTKPSGSSDENTLRIPAFANDGTTKFHIPWSGETSVRFSLRRQSSRGKAIPLDEVSMRNPSLIHIAEVEGLQVFQVVVDQRAVEGTMQRYLSLHPLIFESHPVEDLEGH